MKIPKTTLEQWRVLQAIVEHGGYAQAAEALHRSQSSVSYMVARLQEQVGVELLAIEGRRARLTDKGKVLLAQAVELLKDAERLEALAKGLEEGREAEIRLVVDMAFPTALLLQALTQFMEQAGETRVQLTEAVLSGADEALLAGVADLVIGTHVPPGYLGTLLLDVEFLAVANPSHPLHAAERLLTTDDLRRHRHIVVRDSGQSHPRDEGWLGSTQRWTVTGLETSVAMVEAGLGYAWLPRHMIRTQIDAGSLWPLPLSEGQTRRVALYLIFGCSGMAGPATRQLAGLLEAAASQAD